MNLKAIFILSLIFNSMIVNASEPIIIDPSQEEYSIGKYLEIFEDRDGQLSIDEIRSPAFQGDWSRSKDSNPSFGYTNSAYWTRMTIQNPDEMESLFLEVSYPLLDSIEIYTFQYTELISSEKSGDLLPFQDRNFQSRAFQFKIDAKRVNTIYMRFSSSGPVKFPMTLRTEQNFFQFIRMESLLWGFYFGALTVMVLYNLFIYFSLKDSNYLFYVIYISFAILAQLSLHGFLSFVFPDSPTFVNASLPILLNLDLFFGTIFCMHFLDTKNNTPKLHKVILGAITLIILSLVLFFVSGYSNSMKIAMVVLIVLPIVVFSAGLTAYMNGVKRARFFALAWIPLLLSLIVISLDSLGIITSSILTYNSVQIGTFLEVLLLSFALGDSINIIKKERENALRSQLSESQKVANLSRALQKFVPSEFLECLGRGDITNIKLGDSIQKNMTILFSDIRSFTQISEKMSPEENFQFLNNYLTRISPIIRENCGFVDKYIGDSIMALFANGADDAVKAAIAMKKQLMIYNSMLVNSGSQPIKTGIGIHTGTLTLGTIGEDQRMDGTVISDSVNLASRIEGLTKVYDTHIFISIDTLLSLSNPSDFNYRTVDYIKVLGRENSVAILEILDGDTSDTTIKKIESRADFERGINYYIMSDFENSILAMKKVLSHNPNDVAAKIYLSRAEEYILHGKPDNWDGSASMLTK